jgi:chloramphenicol-sensitive protein RarD
MSDAALATPAEREQRAGFIAAVCAYALWGFLPLYLKLIAFADAREVLAQRIIWCAPAALAAVFALSGWKRGVTEIGGALKPRMLGTLAFSAVFIFLNWWIYVWLVLHARVIEASLAYFLAPLVSVAIGVIFFSERITAAQIAALTLAAIGVVVQGLSLGAPPWMALALCATWSTYAVIRKRAAVPAATGLLVETLVLTPVAAGFLWLVALDAPLAITQSTGNAALLVLAGPITALPLMLFAFGARRVTFTALGLMQYCAPTLQFCLGLAFGEPFTPLRAASFALIWIGLILFSWDSLRRARAVAT